MMWASFIQYIIYSMKMTIEYCYLRSAWLQSWFAYRGWEVLFPTSKYCKYYHHTSSQNHYIECNDRYLDNDSNNDNYSNNSSNNGEEESENEDGLLQICIFEIASSCGLHVESSVTTTDDGYILGLCRLSVPRDAFTTVNAYNNHCENAGDDGLDDASRSRRDGRMGAGNCRDENSYGINNKRGFPVLLIHGLMQDCESFLCCGKKKSIAAVLAHAGYDVWLGNNRGNRYSPLHVEHSADSNEYWHFSIDHLAQYDVPAMVRHICTQTGYEKVVIIGFSQGSAQTFLALSSSSYLQEHVSLFIALSPPLQLAGFRDTWLTALVHRLPFFVTALFGHKAMLMQVLMWKSLLSKNAFARVVASSMHILFRWSCANISESRRQDLFQHVFSPSSVHCVLHWFQIMQGNVLRRYRAEVSHGHSFFVNILLVLKSLFFASFTWFWFIFIRWVVEPIWQIIRFAISIVIDIKSTENIFPKINPSREEVSLVHLIYDLNKISVPVAIIAGDADGLIDTENIHRLVPNCIFSHVEPNYEHLDVIWADHAESTIFPKLVSLLDDLDKPSRTGL